MRKVILIGVFCVTLASTPYRGNAQTPPPDGVELRTERFNAFEPVTPALRRTLALKASTGDGSPIRCKTNFRCTPNRMQVSFFRQTFLNVTRTGSLRMSSKDLVLCTKTASCSINPPTPTRFRFHWSSTLSTSFATSISNSIRIRSPTTLACVRPVDARNDFNVNRNLYYFNGYVFNPKLIFSFIIWSSNSVATVIQGGYIGYEFDKRFKLYGGYCGIPGSRSTPGTSCSYQGVERSMADSFFRPRFTQGIWAEGEILDHLHYVAYIGNSLNTLNVSTSKIDKNFVYAAQRLVGTTWRLRPSRCRPDGVQRPEFHDFASRPARHIVHRSPRGPLLQSRAKQSRKRRDCYNSDGVLFFATGAWPRA